MKKRVASLYRWGDETDPLCCPKCSGKMRILSFIEDGQVIEKIPKHLGLWDINPPYFWRVKARPPPKTTVPLPDVRIDYSDSQLPLSDNYLYVDPQPAHEDQTGKYHESYPAWLLKIISPSANKWPHNPLPLIWMPYSHESNLGLKGTTTTWWGGSPVDTQGQFPYTSLQKKRVITNKLHLINHFMKPDRSQKKGVLSWLKIEFPLYAVPEKANSYHSLH